MGFNSGFKGLILDKSYYSNSNVVFDGVQVLFANT